MTVSELIIKLQALPGFLPVAALDCDNDVCLVDELKLYHVPAYELWYKGDLPDHELVYTVVLTV